MIILYNNKRYVETQKGQDLPLLIMLNNYSKMLDQLKRSNIANGTSVIKPRKPKAKLCVIKHRYINRRR